MFAREFLSEASENGAPYSCTVFTVVFLMAVRYVARYVAASCTTKPSKFCVLSTQIEAKVVGT